MIPSPVQLSCLTKTLWPRDPLDRVSVASLIKEEPSLAWLGQVEERVLAMGLAVGKVGDFPSAWTFKAKEGVFLANPGKSFDALFLTALGARFRGQSSLSFKELAEGMSDRWVVTADQVEDLFAHLLPVLYKEAVDDRQLWFSFNSSKGIDVSFDLGVIDWDGILGKVVSTGKKLSSEKMLSNEKDVVPGSPPSLVPSLVPSLGEGGEPKEPKDEEPKDEEPKSRALATHRGWAETYGESTPPEKAKVNQELVEALGEMGIRQEAKALLLDAEQAYSSKTLIDFGLAPCRIHVPNPDKEICAKLEELGVTALPTTLKTFLLREEGLGCEMDLVFQDTCATLKGNGVYSPKEDVLLMFRRRIFAHRSLYVLEISGRAPDSVMDKGVEEEALDYIRSLAATYGYTIRKERHYSYKNTLGDRGKCGALMWVFFLWLEDAWSTSDQRLAYASGLLEWLARRHTASAFRVYKPRALRTSISSSSSSSSKSKKRSRTIFYSALIAFPTLACRGKMKVWQIPDLTEPTHAYCLVCDGDRAIGSADHETLSEDDGKPRHKAVALPLAFRLLKELIESL